MSQLSMHPNLFRGFVSGGFFLSAACSGDWRGYPGHFRERRVARVAVSGAARLRGGQPDASKDWKEGEGGTKKPAPEGPKRGMNNLRGSGTPDG
jgi:hypothetical protein